MSSSRNHGARTQEACINFIEERLSLGIPYETFFSILKKASNEYNVPRQTLNRWWKHYETWGQCPFETKEDRKKFKRIRRLFKRMKAITEELVQCIKFIVDEFPVFYFKMRYR